MKDTDLLNARLTKVQQDFDQQLLNCDQLATENTQKAAELKAKEDEINGLKQDTVRLTKMREAIQRKLRTIEDQKMEVEQQKETLKGQIAGLEKGIEKTFRDTSLQYDVIHVVNITVSRVCSPAVNKEFLRNSLLPS